MMQLNSSIVAPFRIIHQVRSSVNMKKRFLISKKSFQSSTNLLDKQRQQRNNNTNNNNNSNNMVSGASSSSSSSSSASRQHRDMSPNSGRRHLEALTSAVHAKTNLMAASYSSKRQQHSKSSLFVAPDGSSSSFIKFDATNESMLPKQPLPDLNASMTRYMNSLRPLLIAGREHDKLKYTEECVRRFLDASSANNGHVLQDILYQRAMSRDNWALEKNLDQYLMDTKNPLPIHANPAKVMKPLKFEDENAYLSYVTSLMKAIHSFKVKIDTDTLELDRCNAYSKGQPMCMEQYKNIFSSYRVPGVERDCFRVHNDDLANQFIIVMSRGQLFKVDLIVNSKMVDDLELFHQLKEIRRTSEANQKPEQELGYLTSMPRCEWATVRQTMCKNPVNARSLDLIERSSFMICLDEKVDSSEFQNEDVKSGLQLLHGSGIKFNSRNRWHEKTLQFVVSEDGVNGLVREHSPSEGPITVNLINHVYKYLKSSKSSFDSSEIYPFSEPERLEWSLDDELVSKVNQARQNFDSAINNFDLTIFNYEKFGRSYPKLFNMSPDSFLQVVYQLAYYRIYGRLPVQASIGSQRRFYRGRADYYRTPSIDSLKFCMAMTSPSTSVNERFYLFEKAVETQTRNMVDTILGNGYDCHLLTLKKIAAELNSELPAIFKDPSFEFNSNFQLLTSQVTTVDDGTFSCFSPSHKIGYGSSYNFKPNNILFTMSSYKSVKSNSISSMSDSLVDSLDQVFNICLPRLTTQHSSSSSSNERK